MSFYFQKLTWHRAFSCESQGLQLSDADVFLIIHKEIRKKTMKFIVSLS